MADFLPEKVDVSNLQVTTIELHKAISTLYINLGVGEIPPLPHPECIACSELERIVIDTVNTLQDAILYIHHGTDAVISLRQTIRDGNG